MFNPAELEPEIHECEYEYQARGKTNIVKFHVREPSGTEVMQIAKKAKKESDANDNFRELFSRFIVNEDGSAITTETVDGLVKMGFRHMKSIAEIVNERIGLAAGEAKKD